MGKLSGGHQAQIMVLAVDDTDTADGNICVVTGSKDHYIKVSLLPFTQLWNNPLDLKLITAI